VDRTAGSAASAWTYRREAAIRPKKLYRLLSKGLIESSEVFVTSWDTRTHFPEQGEPVVFALETGSKADVGGDSSAEVPGLKVKTERLAVLSRANGILSQLQCCRAYKSLARAGGGLL